MNWKIIILFLFSISDFESTIAQKGIARNYSGGGDAYQLNYIKIEGETNVNSFGFTYRNTLNNVNSTIVSLTGYNKKEHLVEFKIPVKGFKGENPIMVKDFYNLLKAEHYPFILVGIEKAEMENLYINSNESGMYLYLTISNITNYVECDYRLQDFGEYKLLQGRLSINLTDFNLTPPQKMFGMLQVKNQIMINFEFIVQSNNLAQKAL